MFEQNTQQQIKPEQHPQAFIRKQYIPKEDLLKCRLCTDIFKKPITISCGHTFCYNCIYKFMKQHSQTLKEKTQSSKKLTKELNSQDKNQTFLKNQQQSILQNQKNQTTQLKHEAQLQQKSIPVPLCPMCSSLIWKPLKLFKENLTISNLISSFKFKPTIEFKELKYDENIQNFTHKILLKVDKLKTDPLPFCYNEINFKTCFIDDIQNQDQKSYIVIQWPSIANLSLAGKIIRVQESNHTHQPYQANYKAHFYGMFFVKVLQVKTIQINLNSRYYTNTTFYSQQKFSDLTICTTQQMYSKNILNIDQFNRFLGFYDTLNNPHFLSQVYRMIDQRVFLQRSNAQAMMYCCIRLLKIPQKQKKQIVECFDDQKRMERINNFLDRNSSLAIDEFMNIKIPGKYNSNFVFGIIFLLILLHWYQN